MDCNDISIAKLISRGLVEPLSAEEQSQLRDYLCSSKTSQKFAELSAEIQMILASTDIAQADPLLRSFLADVKRSPPSDEGSHGKGGGEGGYDDMEPGPGLSQLSRARIARRLAEEMQAESDSSETIQSEYDRTDDKRRESDRFGGRRVAEDETKYRGNNDQRDNNPRNNDTDADEKTT
ncbi:MAG: hypothetical protein U0930_04145 [Pirellulales bacterium]